METILRPVIRNKGATIGIVLLVIVGLIYNWILGMNPEEHEEFLETIQDFLPIVMFITLASLLFTGFPVA